MSVTEVDAEVQAVKRALRDAGVPSNLVGNIATRALRSGRRQTGEFRSNRNSRWTLKPNDPQYGTEEDCKVILLRLYAMLLEFEGAPQVPEDIRMTLQGRLGRPLVPNSFRDELTLEKLSYEKVAAEALDPRPGISGMHIGHRDPTLRPMHIPDNIEWRTERSNLIQGNLTLREARTKLVELIARYFELGEVTITPDRSA
jgi:hypothetical protein